MNYWTEKQRADRLAADNSELRAQLRTIAEQKKSDEWTEEDLSDAGMDDVSTIDGLDWIGGFDAIVDVARMAIGGEAEA